MEAIDGIALTVLVLSTLFGVWRGFTHISLNWCLWILVTIAIARFRAPVAGLMGHFITSPILDQIASSLAILIGVVIIGSFLSARIVRMVRATPMSGPDRLLGGVLGFILGGACVVVLFSITTLTRHTTLQELGNNSQLAPYIQLGINQLKQLAPLLGSNINSSSLPNNLGNLNNLSQNVSSIIQGLQGMQ
ncbi:MAG: CvpA family protein [Acetobacter sp.]|nr:CvpA family protein [Acetobacter sp.]